ncbi:MAG: Stk1 family PASTA domain-containing Ser/Thr kinase [Kineosporiaceae bacterium]
MTDGPGYPRAGGDGFQTGGVPRLLGGRYQLDREIGRGGMAEVYAGRDTRLGRTVAVKVLKTDLARDPSFQSRFKREAQSAASLNHPAIVAVYDTGDEQVPGAGGHLPFIVMEYLQGRTLKEVLAEHERLNVEDSLRVTAGVLDALQYSHRNGIVHRDIKPANVMVTDAGEIKVMDFGIARAITDTGATMTGTNAVLGTAQYLSPEQAKGETVDNRSDLYSTACLLFELLTGRPPFVGDSPVSLAYQHVGEQPQPPSALVPDLPPDLDRVVMRGLTKDRTQRYQSAEDFIADLDRVATGVPVGGADATQVVAAAAAGAGLGAATARLPQSGADTQAWPVQGTARPTGYGSPYDTGTQSPYDTGTQYPQPGDDEPPRRKLAWLWILLVVLALLAVGVLAWAYFSDGGGQAQPTPTTTAAAEVTMPDLVGRTYDEAVSELEGLGFTDIQQQPQETVEAEPQTVLDQQPAASSQVATSITVVLTVAVQPGQVAVPDVRGLSQADARQQLTDIGLQPGDVRFAEDPEIEQDAVVGTDPAAGSQVAPGSTVNLIVASGLVEVPGVEGQPVNDAIAAIQAAGLRVEQMGQASSEPPGTVIDQNPPPGDLAPAGSTVQIIVAQPQATTVTATPTTSPTTSPTPTEPDPTAP